jgi:hypothetical protein
MRNWSRYERDEWWAYEQCNDEFRKQERYCKDNERSCVREKIWRSKSERCTNWMCHKDQVMTVCKVALTNLAMWVRDVRRVGAYEMLTRGKRG